MGVTADIVASYRRPGEVAGRLAAGPAQEGRALAYLIIGCGLIFIAQLPRIAREAELADDLSVTERASGELLFWLFFAPLFFYGLAAMSRVITRLLSGHLSWYGARIATFWSLLATAPIWLFRGLVAGFIGPSPTLDVVTLLALIAWAMIWALGLRGVAQASHPIAAQDGVS